MGNNVNNPNQSNQQEGSNLALGIDLKKDIQPNLKQLLNWSLGQIRQIYSFFRRRKNSPILNRTQFARLIGLSRTTSFYLFPFLDKKDGLTVFQVISILVLTSYSNMQNKIHFLFLVFDLTGKKSLRLSETIILYKSIVRGFCKLTNQKCPQSYLVQKYAKTIFTKSDLNQDQGLQIQQISDGFENNAYSTQLFGRFEPKYKIIEEYSIFNQFHAYNEIERIQIQKIILQKNYGHESIMITNYDQFPKISSTLNYNTNQIKIKKQKTQQNYKTLSQLRRRDLNLSTKPKSLLKHRKITNVLIIKGASVTKKQIFQLKQYFQKLSNGNKIISMQQFLEAFSGQKFDHMRSVTASLFNFLDRKQTGKITFIDLLYKVYPSLSEHQLEIIQGWVRQYQKMYDADHKKQLQNKDEVKIKTLPKSCMKRVKQIFDLFDIQKKGWISLQNLKNSFNQVFTEKQIVQMFQKRDTDHDGKLQLQEFVRILLPSDIQIQGCKIR